MYRKRKFFQASLRDGVDIKQHIASEMLKEMRNLNRNVQNFSKKMKKESIEKEK